MACHGNKSYSIPQTRAPWRRAVSTFLGVVYVIIAAAHHSTGVISDDRNPQTA